MKAIISNRIYMVVDDKLHRELAKELTYEVPSHNPEIPIIIKNLSIINNNIQGGKKLISIPSGRTDLIPKNFEIEDKRVLHPVNIPLLNNIEPRMSQKEFIDFCDDSCILNAKPGWGKAQPYSSKIRVEGGWTTMGDIKEGDFVKTPSGSLSKVIGKYNHKNKNIFKVTFCDGRTVECCDEHLWSVYINRSDKLVTVDTNKLKELTKGRVYIPLVEGVHDSKKSLPIHPYLLGFLIGDGGLTNSVSFSTSDEDILEYIETLIPDGHKISFRSKYDYNIVGPTGKTGSNIILNALKKLDLFGKKSEDKFIPEIYKYGSEEDKMLLLQGIMDADGWVDNGNSVEFGSSSKKLAEDVAELLYSLGARITMQIKKTKHSDFYKFKAGRLPFEVKKRLFRLNRKVLKIKPGQYDNCKKLAVKSVEFSRVEDCACIAIDSEDRLYITDNYIVTHNTFASIFAAQRLGQKTLIITHTVALRNQWEREIVKITGIKPGIIGSGKFNIDAPIVVANTQSLIKHLKTINKEFGSVFLDEMHHVASPTFTKIINSLFARYKIGLSGTLRRKDGKHVVFQDYFSNKKYVPKDENTLKPEIHVYAPKFRIPDGSMWADRVNRLVEDPDYQGFIIALADKYVKMGHQVLVVSDRVAFLKFCESISPNSSVCVTSLDDREKAHRQIISGQARELWGSINIYSEGISLNSLSCIIMACPINNDIRLEQLIARINRQHPGKLPPVFVDIKFCDYTGINQFKTRSTFYRQDGYKVRFVENMP